MKLFIHFLLVLIFLSGPNPTRAAPSSSIAMRSFSTIIEETTGKYFGYSMKSAGDIDKDGYEDVIIGAYGKSMAYVIYGGPSLSTSIPVTGLNPTTTGFTITGVSGDTLGLSVSGAGDVNKDGYADIIIGAPYQDSRKGAVYVIYGGARSAMSHINLSTQPLNPKTTGFTVTGVSSSDNLGYSVSSAGDINNDKYDDIIIGAFGTGNYKGAVYVIYGGEKSSMSDINLGAMDLVPSSTGFKVTGKAINDRIGYAVSGGGDINNDEHDDIVIGGYYKDELKGVVYLIYGGPKSSMRDIDLSVDVLNPITTGFTMVGEASGPSLGISVSNAGSVNGDIYADIVIGASGTNNKVFVIYGGPKSTMKNIDFSTGVTLDPATTGFIIKGRPSEYFGASVSNFGDINNDGFDDILIGSYGTSVNTGSAYLVYGAKTSSLRNIDISSTTMIYSDTVLFKILGDVNYGKFGTSVGFADVTGDGYSEILVGAGGQSNSQGNAYILTYHKCSEPCKICEFLSSTKCESCIEGHRLQNSQCQSCSSNCKSCPTSISTCQTCFSSYYLHQAGCVNSCPSGAYKEGQTCRMCSDAMPDCGMCSSGSACTLCTNAKMIYRKNQCVDYCPDDTFVMATECIDCPLGCSKCTSAIACEDCINGYEITKFQGTTLCVLKQPPVKEVEEKDSEKAAAGVFEGTSLVGASLSSGSSLPLNFGMVAKILRNFKYLDMTVSTELQETFYSWKVASGFMSAPKSWKEKFPANVLPRVFSRYGLHSAFLINFWKPLMMALIGLALFGIFKALEVAVTGSGRSVLKQINIAASNFALTQFYSNLDDILFYFILEVRSTEFKGGFYIFSWVLAVILLLVGGALVFLHYVFVGKYQNIKGASEKQLENFALKCENVRLIFKDFKDQTSLTQSFLMINVIRSVISSILFATLFEYPLVQISFFLVLNILMIVYLCNKKPFKELSDTCGQIFCEIILLLAIISAFFMGLFDHAESYPVEAIKGFSKFIIILNFILLFGCAILMLVNIGKMLYKSYQERKGVDENVVKDVKIHKRIDENSMITTTKFTRPTLTQGDQYQMNDLSQSEYDNIHGSNNSMITTTKFTRPTTDNYQNDLSENTNSEYDNINNGNNNSIITTTKFARPMNDLSHSQYDNVNENNMSEIYDVTRGTGEIGGEWKTPSYHQNMMINGPNEVNFERNYPETTKKYSQKSQYMEESFEKQSYGDIIPQQRGSRNSFNHSRRFGNHNRIKKLILEGPRIDGNNHLRNRSNK